MKCFVPVAVVAVACAPADESGERTNSTVPQAMTITIDGAELEARVWGSGETIIALPGLGSDVGWYRLLAPRIAAEGYRVVALNPRGVAGSTGDLETLTLDDMARDVALAIEALGLTEVHLLGWAFGNRVARATAVNHPERVKTVTLLAVGGRFPPAPAIRDAFRQQQDVSLPDSTRVRLRQQSLYAKASDAVALETLIAPGTWSAARAAQSAGPASAPLDTWWSGGEAPMLVVQGAEDVLAPRENGESLAEEFPNRVTLVEVPDAAHMLLVEQPDVVAVHVVRFLRRMKGHA